ncbi:MAG: hypothetical protein AAGE98_04135 [Actinomycetota bacterium]
MKRLLLLVSIALVAAACGGGSGSVQTAPAPPRSLAAPDVEPTPSTTLAPLERVVLGEQTPAFEPSTLGTVFSFDAALNGGGPCGNFLAALLDPATWSDGDQADELTAMVEPFGPAGAEIAAGLTPTEVQSLDGVLDAFEAIDSLTMQECGVPGGGMFFVIAGTTAITRFCSVDQALDGSDDGVFDPEACDDDFGERFHPTTFPCLLATGLGWGDMAAGVGPVYAAVTCEGREDLYWDPYAPGWFNSLGTQFGE